MKQRFHQSRVVPLSLSTGRRSKFIAPQEIMKVCDHSSFRPKSQCFADIIFTSHQPCCNIVQKTLEVGYTTSKKI